MVSEVKDRDAEAVGKVSRLRGSALDPVDREFELAVTAARISESPKVMTNRSMSHAQHVIRELLEFGLSKRETTYIVSGTLNEQCYDDLTFYVDKFDAAGLAIKAWVTNVEPDDATSRFAEALKRSRISSLAKFPIEKPSPPHFVVVGSQAYRFETDHPSAKAILSFNDPSLASPLQSLVTNF